MRRWLIVIVVIVVIGACAAFAILGRAPSASGAGGPAFFGRPTQVNLKTVRVDTGDLQSIVTATGSIVANRQSALGFDFPGTIVAMPVQEGQQVTAGQLLASEDDTTQQLNVQQADFAVQAAQAALDKLLEPVDARDVANAQANVKAAEGSYMSLQGAVSPSQLKAAQLGVQQAQAAAQNATLLRMGAGGQFKSTDPNYMKAVAQEALANAGVQVAQLQLQDLSNGTSLASAAANIAYSQTRLAQVEAGPHALDIENAQLQLATAKLQKDQAQHVLDKVQLKAPFAGTVTKINIKQGEVSGGPLTPVLVLTDDTVKYVDVDVDESDIGQVQIGQNVQFTIDALPGQALSGKVVRIKQIADTSTSVITYTVRVALDNSAAPIKVGMTANATFIVQSVTNVVRIPNEYLKQNRSTGQTTVNLLNADGTYTETPIKIGVQGPDYTEVLEGLNAGDTVALVLNNTASGQ